MNTTYGAGRNPLSREAYNSVDRGAVEKRILWFLRYRANKGATTDEIEHALELLHQTASPAVIKLRKDGLIAKNGLKRATRSGRRAEVHVAI